MSSSEISDIKDEICTISAQLFFLSSAIVAWDRKALDIGDTDKYGFSIIIDNIANQVKSIDRQLTI